MHEVNRSQATDSFMSSLDNEPTGTIEKETQSNDHSKQVTQNSARARIENATDSILKRLDKLCALLSH